VNYGTYEAPKYVFFKGFQRITPDMIIRNPNNPWVVRDDPNTTRLLYVETKEEALRTNKPLLHIDELKSV